MSFRTREQAYRAWEADEFAKPGDKIPFLAGWDARQADLPDRDEWIALFEDQGRWATSADRADAVMALLRGETKP